MVHKNPLFKVFGFILVTAIVTVSAQYYQPIESNRVKINFGATPWKFIKSDIQGAEDPAFNDASWTEVGIPHTWCDSLTFLNDGEGGPGSGYISTGWYRKTFTLDEAYADRKVFIEFEGAHVGAQVYVNGTFIPGNSAFNPEATHVIGFIPFVVDLTPYVNFGSTENVIAVRVSNSNAFYDYPGFGIEFKYGMGDGGLFRPVYLHICDRVYVPVNVYSIVNNWGTYVATMSASESSADIKILTNVQNESGAAADVTVRTQIVDSSQMVVWTGNVTQAVEADSNLVFDQEATVTNPQLWYPANSLYGRPYMYSVYHHVIIDGEVVDVFKSPLGIRELTWNDDFPVINGHPHYLWGGASRYDYPALGMAVPEEQQWRDIKLMAECGGNFWRPGHATHSPEFTAACDAFGVMIAQPSGDVEGSFMTSQLTEYRATLKRECHRDMIIRDRNNPSIVMWESSNGPLDTDFARELRVEVDSVWDPVLTRAMSDRGYWLAVPSAQEDIVSVISCSATGCEVSFHQQYPDIPSWGAEAWGGSRGLRADYDHELSFAEEYVRNWKNGKNAKCFGLAHWYMADTPGESGVGRSFGASMMDWDRIPKALYWIYQACWTHYELKPVVNLVNHWNRSGGVTVNAFSNCPSVRLLINGVSQGERTPHPDDNDDNSLMPAQCQWNVTFEPGILRAEGLDASGNVVCSDELVTAGSPDHIELTVEPHIVRPDNGEEFEITANGSDAAIILATVVDNEGNWCPTASNNITFSVSGPGRYCGGADNNTSAGGLHHHSPFDPELSAEGGMTKIAVRSKFDPGEVTVSATGAGLNGTATTSFTISPVPSPDIVKAAGHRYPGTAVPCVNTRLGTFGNTIKYYISQPAKVAVTVYNASGQIIYTLKEQQEYAGWHPINITASKSDIQTTGVYFVRLTAGESAARVARFVHFR